jgi:general stress protein 26
MDDGINKIEKTRKAAMLQANMGGKIKIREMVTNSEKRYDITLYLFL